VSCSYGLLIFSAVMSRTELSSVLDLSLDLANERSTNWNKLSSNLHSSPIRITGLNSFSGALIARGEFRSADY